MAIFIAWIVFILLEQKNTSHEKVCKSKDFCETAMLSGMDNVLEFNQYMKSDKMPYIIHADVDYFIKTYMDAQIIQQFLQQQK